MICSTEFEGLKVTLTKVPKGYMVRQIVGKKRKGELFTTIEKARNHYLGLLRIIIGQSCGIEEHITLIGRQYDL